MKCMKQIIIEINELKSVKKNIEIKTIIGKMIFPIWPYRGGGTTEGPASNTITTCNKNQM